jgi:hypothetical protein
MLVLVAVGIECHLIRADRDVGLYVALLGGVLRGECLGLFDAARVKGSV